jgi:anti-sigma regulatory factor (Ser/Thr protein kinase)
VGKQGYASDDTMILRLSINLPEDTDSVRTARRLSRCLLEDIRVELPVIDEVETIVAELCSNVIRHARSEAAHYLVTLEYKESQAVITVTDEGRGFAREDVPPMGAPRPDGDGGEPRYGGFGLFLLEGLSDKVDFTATVPHGTTVRVEKALRYETRGDADQAAAERDAGSSSGVTVGTE